jgi:hypothetical protein
VINTGSVNHINNIWPYFYAIIWHHTISIFLIQYNTIWHIFNHICTIYTISNTEGQSATEALIRHLETSGIMHHILKDPDSNRLKGLFITCPESVQYLQSHHDVILIDNTYSTNRFDMPLMDIIG